MLTRRHIRVKVMQSLYALSRNSADNMAAEKKFLDRSMNDMYDMFLLDLALLVEVKNHALDYIDRSRSKYLPTEEDIHPNLKFVENQLIAKIEESEPFNELLEKKKLNNWFREPGYVQMVWNELRNSELYKSYIATRETTFEEDKKFVVRFFKEIIAPHQKIHEYFEDYRLTWMDDLPIVNTAVVRILENMNPSSTLRLPRLFKNEDDRSFAFDLFQRTLMYQSDLKDDIEGKTLNWDQDRLADIDAILLRMALCEFQFFPTIPVKVSINEYLEISKEYSTPKSSVFINGVLDKISKEYKKEGKLNKSGRGLR
ncbi:MAG TPA: transcription antitermination factor NusB [Flavobacteriaceae bacterium]|nr:transcription antitermination factor NusB [Flavobacteriaceae bacterium]